MDIEDIVAAVETSTHFNNFRQKIMHLQDKLTDTDIAIHARKMARKASKGDPFNFKSHKKAFTELSYSEFLAATEEE